MEEVTTSIWEFGNQVFNNGLLSFCIRAVLLLATAWIISRFIHKGIDKAIEHNMDSATPLSFIERVLRFLMYAIAIFVILSDVKFFTGFSTALLGATSVISVIVGLAAQETFGNFISGFFLAIYHPFNVGDSVMLKENNISGVVSEITFRHTVLITIENTKLIIPNSVMNTAIIENRIFGQDYYTRYVKFDISYDSDVDKAIAIIQENALKIPDVIDIRTDEEKSNNKEPFIVRVEEFNDSGVQLNFPLYTTDLSSSLRAASALRRQLLIDFKANGIEIPYNKVEIVQPKS